VVADGAVETTIALSLIQIKKKVTFVSMSFRLCLVPSDGLNLSWSQAERDYNGRLTL